MKKKVVLSACEENGGSVMVSDESSGSGRLSVWSIHQYDVLTCPPP
jgi:hypothetical protein